MKTASKLIMRLLILGLLLLLPAFAQQPAPPPEDSGSAQDSSGKPIRTTVNVVLAPTTVQDKNGDLITGLGVDDFKLLDNDKPQQLSKDVSVHPLSLVVAVQANSAVSESLPKIQKIGSLIGDLIMGASGEAAVIEFDHRIRTVQDFTSEPDKVSDALTKVKAGSSQSRMIDAVSESIRMLQKRPNDHRRVILLISETGDRGSEGHVREAMTEAQFANVVIYSVNISHLVTELTDKGIPPGPPPIPVTAQNMPPGAAVTPTTVSQNRDLGNFIPALDEIYKGAKGIFVANPMDVFTKYTGGRQYSFIKEKTLERELTRLGEELHNQYLLSYHPNNMTEGGYHRIQVIVDRPDLEVRTRPGYWTAALQ